MNSGPSREALNATFNELTHLLVTPARLTVEETELETGVFGQVLLAALDKSSEFPRKVAIKELQIVRTIAVRRRIAFCLAKELKVWAKVNHPNILGLIGYYLCDNYGCAHIVSAYMVNGNVMQYIQRSHVSVAARLKFVQGIAAGLTYLHDFDPPICHGDLKPANVLINEGLDVVLCDFGLFSLIQESGAASGVPPPMSTKGSTRYMSPELLLDEGSKHTLQSDIWAWGCTAFEVMTGTTPYPTKTKESTIILEMFKKSAPGTIDSLSNLILGTGIDLVCRTGLSSLRSIIPQCWDFDPAGRPSSSIILDRIATPVKREACLGAWENQEPGISSLSIGGDPRYAVSAQSSSGMCKVCRVRLVDGNFEFCSKACGRAAPSGHTRQASDPRQGYGQGYGQGSRPEARGADADYSDDDDANDNYNEDSGYGGSTSPRPSVPHRGNSLCMNCQQYPKIPGRDFCSKACLNAAASRLAASAQGGNSDYQFAGVVMPNYTGPGQRPPFPNGQPAGFVPMGYQNTGGFGDQGYPPNWQQQQQWQQEPYGQQQLPSAVPTPQAPPPPPPGRPCKIVNCNGTEYAPGSKYCSNKCRQAAVKQGLEIACLMCKELPKAPKTDFCGKGCSDRAHKAAPILLDLPKTDPQFADIVKQFNDTWQGSNNPTVHRICKVVNSKAIEDRFQAYQQKVEQAGNWVSQGKTAGNENLRWHGTVRECTVGDNPNKLDMCTSTSCRVCCVIRRSFDMKYVAVGVYGLGIYTNAYSSTSHGYTRVATKGSPYRAMFLTRVVTGKEHIFTSGVTDPNARAPPTGYDSVAVCEKHSALIVFQNEAICPAWLVLYS